MTLCVIGIAGEGYSLCVVHGRMLVLLNAWFCSLFAPSRVLSACVPRLWSLYFHPWVGLIANQEGSES